MSPREIYEWHLPAGWEPLSNELLIVGWQCNLTMSPEQRRPVRRIDEVVDDYYKRDLTSADYYYWYYL